jgi:hypothetical protein
MSIIIVAYLFACAVTAMIASNRKGNFWRLFVISIFCSPIGVLAQEGPAEWTRVRTKSQDYDKSNINQTSAQVVD